MAMSERRANDEMRRFVRITFRLRFHTRVGQSILLTGNHGLLGDGKIDGAVPLQYVNEEFWEANTSFERKATGDGEIIYDYVLRNEDGSLVYDWGKDKRLTPALVLAEEVLIIDSWNNAGLYENAFYTVPFQEVLLKANFTKGPLAAPGLVSHIFRVKAPLLGQGQTLCLLGGA